MASFEEQQQQTDTLVDADDDDSNTLYLENFECVYVRESEKCEYFTCRTVGKGEVKLFKKPAQKLLAALNSARKIYKPLLKTEFKKDQIFFEEVVDESVGKKTQVTYQTRLTLSVFMGHLGLYLRTYYYVDDEGRFQPTTKAVQFALDDKELATFKTFILEKASPPKSLDTDGVEAIVSYKRPHLGGGSDNKKKVPASGYKK